MEKKQLPGEMKSMPPNNDEIIKELIKRVDELERGIKVIRSQQVFSPLIAGTNYSVTLNADSSFNTYTSVVRLEVGALTLPSNSITMMRITMAASSVKPLVITNSFIGHAATVGNSYDFLSTPVQLFWSGSASITIPIGGTALSDWAVFSYNKTNALSIATYTNGGAALDGVRYRLGLGANVNNYYKVATNEAGTVIKSAGYSTAAGQNVCIAKVESNGF